MLEGVSLFGKNFDVFHFAGERVGCGVITYGSPGVFANAEVVHGLCWDQAGRFGGRHFAPIDRQAHRTVSGQDCFEQEAAVGRGGGYGHEQLLAYPNGENRPPILKVQRVSVLTSALCQDDAVGGW